MATPRRRPGFTVIETLVTLAIVGVLATFTAQLVVPVRTKVRDRIRTTDLNTIYRFLGAASGTSVASDWPEGVPAEGDLQALLGAVSAKDGARPFSPAPRDPRARGGESGYRYRYDSGSGRVVVYANLEDRHAPVTLPYAEPTPGGGRGVIAGQGQWAAGLNGTDRYYQVTN